MAPSEAQTQSSRFVIQDEHVVRGTAFKKIHTAEDARENVRVLLELMAGHPRALVIDMREVVDYQIEAAKVYDSVSATQQVRALAIIVKGWLGRVLGNLAISMQGNKTPTRLFESPEAALLWVQQFRDRPAA